MPIATAQPVFNIVYDDGRMEFTTIEGRSMTVRGHMEFFDLYIHRGTNSAIPFGIFCGEINTNDRLIEFEVHFKDDCGVITERSTPPAVPLTLLRANASIAVFKDTQQNKEMVVIREPQALWDIERKLFCGRHGKVLLFVQLS